METVFLIFASLAAIIHVYIFILETFLWTKPIAKKVFGITREHAGVTKEMAANQGVYNGAIAGVVLVGIAFYAAYSSTIGYSLIFAGTGIMTAAAVYLFVSSPDKRSAAIKQLIFPFGTLVAGVILTIL